MARIRTVKPEFWTSEQVMELSIPARLLFLGMWNFCDDAGTHPASAKTLKAEVFPGDDMLSANVQRLVDELLLQGLLIEFEAGGKWYWHVTGWKHQKIDKPNVKHPTPPEGPHKPWVPRSVADQSSNDRRTVDDHSPPEGKGMEGNGREGKGEEQAAAATPPACVPTDALAHVGEGEDASEAASPPPYGTPGLPAPTAGALPSRETQLAVLVRNLERARGKQCRITSNDPQVTAWARKGVTDEQLAEACALAAADRENSEDLSPLNAGFVDVFVTKVLNPPVSKPTGKGGGRQPERTEAERQRENDEAKRLLRGQPTPTPETFDV